MAQLNLTNKDFPETLSRRSLLRKSLLAAGGMSLYKFSHIGIVSAQQEWPGTREMRNECIKRVPYTA